MNRPDEAIFNLFDKCEEIDGAREEGYRMYPDYEAVTHYIYCLERALDRASEIMANGFGCEECDTCYANENHFNCAEKKDWKEYLLKDE